MKIIVSNLFNSIDEIDFGFSTKEGLNRKSPFYFNMSLSVGDRKENVIENRKAFFERLGLRYNQVVLQKQTHSDHINHVIEPGTIEDSDSLITGKPNLGLAISSADCTSIFIYEKVRKIIAAVHSGWRGTQKNILLKTIDKLIGEFNCDTSDMFAFIGPAISQKNYEVDEDVAQHFGSHYLQKKLNKYLLDIPKVNYDMLINSGIPVNQIETSKLCSYQNEFLHSYRREGKKSGRALGVIVLREN
ncbi:MAG: peptidoglycan editing factor PgeF [Melioribacteraceae bacterium]|nr:peptidoglycan editing factor PgeF [Melioribacteraceae bacterium]MCF8353970.1 peptidoglycan editing factor PgeF [Melioribacteraceae bacterium]MCF8393698.1 peptidoglycan editing factor PgeF [Melioribacteraceae bacterium]MCF8419560.1 peptidoglycan editing factor PgeF [Melioribacteraceae bacterium]